MEMILFNPHKNNNTTGNEVERLQELAQGHTARYRQSHDGNYMGAILNPMFSISSVTCIVCSVR